MITSRLFKVYILYIVLCQQALQIFITVLLVCVFNPIKALKNRDSLSITGILEEMGTMLIYIVAVVLIGKQAH